MPNIEIYGFHEAESFGMDIVGAALAYNERLTFLKEKIGEAVKELGVANDAVITVVSSTVRFCSDLRPGPFIRVAGTDINEINAIVELLKQKGVAIDAETLKLNRFIPLEEMKLK